MNRFQSLHTLNIIETYNHLLGPLDRFLSYYFKRNQSIGSNDRKIICEKIYLLTRFWRTLDLFIMNKTWECRLQALNENNIEYFQEKIDPYNHKRYGVNNFIFHKLVESLGTEAAIEQLNNLNSKAPFFIRTNKIKTSTEDLIRLIDNKLGAVPSNEVCGCIQLSERKNICSLEIFKNGFFEIQDEGSQIICNEIPIRKKDIILDFCAGSGGKSLAIADRMSNSGQIFLHDIRENALLEAKKRLKRAGIQNAQILTKRDSSFEKLKNKVDLVIADVPCSGSGVLRRNPESRERINKDNLNNLIKTQREIISECDQFVKKHGLLCYITCSLFKDENYNQIEWLISNYKYKIFTKPIQLLVKKNGHDGFFITILQKQS